MNRIIAKKSKISRRRGQALVEFAIIAFVLSAILAGLLGIAVLALGSFQNNIAAENAGRMLDRNEHFIKSNFVEHFENDVTDPFTGDNSLDDLTARHVYRFLTEYEFDLLDEKGNVVLDDDNNPIQTTLYDESKLVLQSADYFNSQNDPAFPLLNRLLLGQYIFDDALVIDDVEDFHRFPGAVVTNRDGEPTVMIPLLPDSNISDPTGSSTPHGIDRSFHVEGDDPNRFYPVSNDWVAPIVVGRVNTEGRARFRIILFHPSQPASMYQIRVSVDDDGRPLRDANGIYQYPIEAADNATDQLIGNPPDGYTLFVDNASTTADAAPYGGRFGLGHSYALLKQVRPFRRVFETSSVFGFPEWRPVVKATFGTLPPAAVLNMNDESDIPPLTETATPPFTAYGIGTDQAIRFNDVVVDGYRDGPDRYLEDPILPRPPASPTNDFVEHVVQLLPNDEGIWRVSTAVELETYDPMNPTSTPNWTANHELQLWLYRNGARESLISSYTFGTTTHARPTLLSGHVVVDANAGDILQVRLFTDRDNVRGTSPPPPPEIRLTGNRETNFVVFERIGE